MPVKAALFAIILTTGQVHAQLVDPSASYQVQLRETAADLITVSAVVPGNGSELRMATSRPGDIPEVAEAGWPALVRNLRATDATGESVNVTGDGARGWMLERPIDGPLTLEYEVNYAPLEARGWPAPREAAFADAEHLIVIGRSLFITTPAQRSSNVQFTLPQGWQAAVPWPEGSGTRQGYIAASTDDLTENLVAFVGESPDLLRAGGFNLKVIALGHWQPARSELRRVLGIALERLVELIGFDGRADYVVVLLPQLERGGESFRASFALNLDATPRRDNLDIWGNLIAHEVFHYWNGWRLQGADYPSSQWFQEGFTEYVANLALVSGDLISPEAFYAKLAAHVSAYRRLATPLDAPGTRKGPPLYSGGALVAFSWDTMLREATGGKRGVGALLRALLRNTEDGTRPYTWSDINASLESIAPDGWEKFRHRYIQGTEPLPLAEVLARVGLRASQDADGSIGIEPDPAATPSAQALRRDVMRGSR